MRTWVLRFAGHPIGRIQINAPRLESFLLTAPIGMSKFEKPRPLSQASAWMPHELPQLRNQFGYSRFRKCRMIAADRCSLARCTVCVLAWLAVSGFVRAESQATDATVGSQDREIRVGIIGLDTSHAVEFTSLLNAKVPKAGLAGCRVVAAFPHGSKDIKSSISRVPAYTEEVKRRGVKIVDTIEELLQDVDAVLLESNDGRPHLDQALPVLKARKPLYIDKPMAASLVDVLAIFAAAKASETPVFSASSLRYGDATQSVKLGSLGRVLGCDATSPCHLEPNHPDLAWYGIHGVESLFTVMGPGCESVTRTAAEEGDVVVGRWKDGRLGTYRGMRSGVQIYGGMAYGSEGNAPIGNNSGYEPLLVEIVKFFHGGPPPVTEEETVEIFAFIEAADKSKQRGGKSVALAAVLEAAREEAKHRLSGSE